MINWKKVANTVFMMDDQPTNESGPSWKFRRTLIFGAYRLGFAMIVFGGIMFLVDQFGVGVALITGGVSLISIILTAYTATATFEDIKLYKSNEDMEP